MALKNRPLSVSELARNCANAQRSSGPKTLAGKFRATLNALRHGLYSESVRSAMRALGEDPGEFDRVYIDLFDARSSYQACKVAEAPLINLGALLSKRRKRAFFKELYIAKRTQEVIENKGPGF